MSGYKLNEVELQNAISNLPGWTIKEGKLHKEYKFSSFAQAMGWMVSVAIYTEKIEHHPIWLNIYNLVQVDLMTYDLGNVISNLDVELANKMEELSKAFH
ncbi:4a-hydroxytetrahydrobiopterin dehydratase [Plectonema radiosum NIES-515]|jgi:4a-hydroxytetrahydrobiopterin dehydratase|uniref:4a-hydroxytetrahydrobiopterin dehydratase n=1 Tax=Plectonema radiosum NIES-515 TaxID=2986073 RepID=A0ABT3B544_9CYAN|nr:4a-hydroxytetrahydrobiopterin dehydratase [Plectonema radiosum]MCV3216075.1 4a-hydroxytetrahydrobiopterin dehydratase [Plectonema radiosum NIES-515]